MKYRILAVLCFLIVNQCIFAYKLTAYIPKDNPMGVGVIVCPGGSYFWLDKEGEGFEVAQWLCDNGIAAFVLEYAHGGWASYAYHFHTKSRLFPAGYNDLRHAMDSIRRNADIFGIRADRIGCMGFSAGGHLVMHAAEQLAGSSDSIYFVASLYPVVSMTHPCTHRRSRRGLLGEFPSKALKDSLSLENHVPPHCPPVFLMNCHDDPVVHYHNAELLDSALTKHGITHQYERYKTGGHGFGVSAEKTTDEAIQWKSRFIEWLKRLVADSL